MIPNNMHTFTGDSLRPLSAMMRTKQSVMSDPKASLAIQRPSCPMFLGHPRTRYYDIRFWIWQ
jgi:hypothetical protein